MPNVVLDVIGIVLIVALVLIVAPMLAQVVLSIWIAIADLVDSRG